MFNSIYHLERIIQCCLLVALFFLFINNTLVLGRLLSSCYSLPVLLHMRVHALKASRASSNSLPFPVS